MPPLQHGARVRAMLPERTSGTPLRTTHPGKAAGAAVLAAAPAARGEADIRHDKHECEVRNTTKGAPAEQPVRPSLSGHASSEMQRRRLYATSNSTHARTSSTCSLSNPMPIPSNPAGVNWC